MGSLKLDFKLWRCSAIQPGNHIATINFIQSFTKNIIINRRTGETMSELAGVFQLTHSSSDVTNRVLWRLLVSKQDNLNINDRSNIALMVS